MQGFFYTIIPSLISSFLIQGKLKPITLLKHPSILSINFPPFPSNANPPAQFRGSRLSTYLDISLFCNLEKNEIKNYVNSNEPLNCAGGFALEGRGGKYIEKIDGCFSNVMGLSLPWLRRMLLNKGIYI